jgi:hypothetical protein
MWYIRGPFQCLDRIVISQQWCRKTKEVLSRDSVLHIEITSKGSNIVQIESNAAFKAIKPLLRKAIKGSLCVLLLQFSDCEAQTQANCDAQKKYTTQSEWLSNWPRC